MSERIPLKANSTIELYRDGSNDKVRFRILKELDAGSSMICYKAKREDTGRNIILKEFYPKDVNGESVSLIRGADGNLEAPNEEAKDNFDRKKACSYQNNREIRELLNNSGNTDILNTFIPDFTIYLGNNDSEGFEGGWSGSYYQVIDQPELITFEEFCRTIVDKPEENSEYKLLIVMKSIEQLTVCTKALHDAGFLHRDITPGNFGFTKRGDLLPETISLFDTGTFISMKDEPDTPYGTPGFYDPNVFKINRSDIRSDIYSIGATLFHAVCGNGRTYSSEQYDDLFTIVSSSPLIADSEANSDPYLVERIAGILRRSLADLPSGRYANCEELLSDIREALCFLLPPEMNKTVLSGRKWVLQDIEKINSSLKSRKGNSRFMMLYQIYKHPLYSGISGDHGTLYITLAGFDRYGHSFLDAVLQLGQCISKDIDVTVLVNKDRGESADVYLAARPALKEFFEIRKTVSGKEKTETSFDPKAEESYGTINFKEFSGMPDLDKGQIPDYVYISLGKDKANTKFAASVKKSYPDAQICCVAEKKEAAGQFDRGIYPVYVNESTMKEKEFRQIEKTAFVRDLLWDRGIYVDLNEKKKAYFAHNHYAHNACVTGVISLKYILYDLGIDLEQVGNEQASVMFEKIREENREKLIYIEHKRWVVDKLCEGWKPLKDLDRCAVLGENKDRKTKEHSCIVRCGANNQLAKEFGSDVSKWDKGQAARIEKMDGLDQMSVNLHRVYKKASDKIKKSGLISRNMALLSQAAVQDPKVYRAFVEWSHTVSEMTDGGLNPINRYKSLRTGFINAAKASDKIDYGELESIVKIVSDSMRCVLEYCRFINYKYEDEKIFDSLPFILNYSLETKLVKRLYTGDASYKRFGNIADVLIANPAEVFYYVQFNGDIDRLKDAVSILALAKERFSIRSDIRLKIFCQSSDRISTDKIVEALNGISGISVDSTDIISFEERKYDETKDAVFDELKKADDFILIEGTDYKFSIADLSFKGSPRLRYITKHLPHLSVADLAFFGFVKVENYEYDIPMLYENFEVLWNMYSGAMRSRWNHFCRELIKQDPPKELLHVNLVGHNSRIEYQKLREPISVPSSCRECVEKIMLFLYSHRIIRDLPVYTMISPNVLQLSGLNIAVGHEEEIKDLFKDPMYLLEKRAVKYHREYNEDIKRYEHIITYKDLWFDGIKQNRNDIEIRDSLEKAGLIGLVTAKGFTCSSYETYDLIADEGKLLELLVYYSLKTSGLFDDVTTGVTINWEEGDQNEIDLIVTKGFKSAMIECKATAMLKDEYYKDHCDKKKRFWPEAKAIMVSLCEKNKDNSDIISSYKKAVPTIPGLDSSPFEFAKRVLAVLEAD